MVSIGRFYNIFFAKEKALAKKVYRISGFIPKEIFLYKLALTHSSSIQKAKNKTIVAKQCNERLEFLGDSILDAIIADYLFRIYPFKDEGFLTEMRSKIVNRKSLNRICRKLGIDELIIHKQNNQVNESMYGDALEAFIGAIYMDQGYRRVKHFIYHKIIDPHIQLLVVERQIISYKNKLIEYVQKEKIGQLEFELISEKGEGRNKTFFMRAKVGEKELGTGEGKNKKTAEQNAAQNALITLELI